MNLGDRHIMKGKEYVAVYGDSLCTRCEAPEEGLCDHFNALSDECLIFDQDKWQQIVWVKVKK